MGRLLIGERKVRKMWCNYHKENHEDCFYLKAFPPIDRSLRESAEEKVERQEKEKV